MSAVETVAMDVSTCGNDGILSRRWAAEVTFEDDIMFVRNGCPDLADLPALTKGCAAWAPCTIMQGHDDELGKAVPDPYVDPQHRSSERLSLSGPGSEEAPTDARLVGALLYAVGQEYLRHYLKRNEHATVSQGSAFELLRYGPGQRFGEHIDEVKGHPVLAHRRLSVVGFVNDSFEGGEFVFRFAGREPRYVPAEPGMLVLFPSGITHPHEVMPVTSGERFSVVAWYY